MVVQRLKIVMVCYSCPFRLIREAQLNREQLSRVLQELCLHVEELIVLQLQNPLEHCVQMLHSKAGIQCIQNNGLFMRFYNHKDKIIW